MDKTSQFARRFEELEKQVLAIRIERHPDDYEYVPHELWQAWATSAMNLLRAVFGEQSPQYQNFDKAYQSCKGWPQDLALLKGVFKGAKSDYDGGYIFTAEAAISGEILGDFVAMAKAALRESHKDVAAVLACAALEDALKRYARMNGLSVDEASMQEVVGALKSKGLVSGAQKSLLEAMPKIRDYAMHANWDKIQAADVSGMIGFVEQFLLSHF